MSTDDIAENIWGPRPETNMSRARTRRLLEQAQRAEAAAKAKDVEEDRRHAAMSRSGMTDRSV